MEIMTEEEYLTINGASRLDIGDSALHKNLGNNSRKTWGKIVDLQSEKDRQLINRRDILRTEYQEKVIKGEIRPPTRIEKLIIIAQGMTDNIAVQAARRILIKLKIDWK